ncbi:MAG: hypothetical protein K2I66_07770 [Bacteroidales bacterium]|nr:hypothetical protein [Bacteroidales bacterium]
MKSKVASIVAGCFASLLLLSSCSKDIGRYKGSYSFKTSGNLMLRVVEVISDTLPVSVGDTLTLPLIDEWGQMNVVVRDKGAKTMLVTMDVMGGDATAFEAEATESHITLLPKERYITLQILNNITQRTQVTVTGKGERYDNVLLFKLDYSGTLNAVSGKYEILESRVECVAERNEN